MKTNDEIRDAMRAFRIESLKDLISGNVKLETKNDAIRAHTIYAIISELESDLLDEAEPTVGLAREGK